MSIQSRLVLAGLWIASLVIASEWNTAAQSTPGVEVRFIQTKNLNGVLTGHLVANASGTWVPVQVEPAKGGLVPLGST